MHNRITSSDENFSDDEIFAEVALDDPTQVGAFFPKVTENGTEEYGPFNDNHVINYGVFLL